MCQKTWMSEPAPVALDKDPIGGTPAVRVRVVLLLLCLVKKTKSTDIAVLRPLRALTQASLCQTTSLPHGDGRVCPPSDLVS